MLVAAAPHKAHIRHTAADNALDGTPAFKGLRHAEFKRPVYVCVVCVCVCVQGYYMLNTAPEGRLPHYICQEEEQPWYVKSPWILALIIIGATSIVIVTLFLLYYRKGAKPAFVHQYNMMRKRIKVRHRCGK